MAETFNPVACDPLAWLGGERPAAVLIAGPTASGKSALAMRIAEALGGEIVNADSMQVYADLRILSARPSMADEAAAPHRLYGFVASGVEFNAGDYLSAIATTLSELSERDKPAIIVGGTGLYFKLLTEGLVETPAIPAEIKARVAALPDLHAALSARDPELAARLNPADAPRLQRALEVFEATGRSLAEWRREGEHKPILRKGAWRGLALDPDREELARRIDRRFEAMIEAGALDEAAAIRAMALPRNRGVMKAHGLPHLIDHLDGLISLPEAIIRGQSDTRRYAKRQRTFMRGQLADFTMLSGPRNGVASPPEFENKVGLA
jgi:tRNA dimethylallyltransferase